MIITQDFFFILKYPIFFSNKNCDYSEKFEKISKKFKFTIFNNIESICKQINNFIATAFQLYHFHLFFNSM